MIIKKYKNFTIFYLHVLKLIILQISVMFRFVFFDLNLRKIVTKKLSHKKRAQVFIFACCNLFIVCYNFLNKNKIVNCLSKKYSINICNF